ncbi:MAG: S41 family peptidase [Bacteroidales bacterium]|nr:S41 family peptidase [Bacteroidales bacterium]
MLHQKIFRNSRINVLILVLLFIFSTVTGSYGQSVTGRQEIQKLIAAMQIIELAYVDSINMQEVVTDAIVKSLKNLDPHSSYISKEDVRKANEPLEGSFDGIGVTFQIYHDTILVISPVPGGPSEKLGILSGDKIVVINGENATGSDINNEWVMERLRGKKGTTVDVSIARRGRADLMNFTIERDKIPLNSIDASFIAAPEIGYIRLNRFSKTSIDEFTVAIENLKSQGMSKLILDLRGNSGGFLNIAVELADEFIDMGKLIVYTEGLNSLRQNYYATPAGTFKRGSLVVIIDEASASASEIVSGAVQDLDRGLVIGRRSFGKGLVQRPFSLPDGSVIRLTTARYFTPSGRSIQRPYENGSEEYYRDMRDRYRRGEFIYADSIAFPDSLKFSTIKGRTVYGGGGIMPDVFIPWDSTMFSDYYVEIRRKGLINSFTLDYVVENRTRLHEEYQSVDQFKDDFQAEGEVLRRFLARVEEEGVKFNKEDWEVSQLLIKTQIKALIARNLWDINAYYQIMLVIDNEFNQAVEMLQDEDTFRKFNIG